MIRAQTLLKLFYLSIVDPKDDYGLQADYKQCRLAYESEVEQLYAKIQQTPASRKAREVQEHLIAMYEELILNDNDMTGVNWSMLPEEFFERFKDMDDVISQKFDPAKFKTNVYKKEEQERPKEQVESMRLKVWRDIMHNDDLRSYPNCEENILDEILGGDKNVLEQLKLQSRMSHAIIGNEMQNKKRDLITDIDPGAESKQTPNLSAAAAASGGSAPVRKFKTKQGMFQETESDQSDNRNSKDGVAISPATPTPIDAAAAYPADVSDLDSVATITTSV